MNKTGLIAKISMKYVLYLEIFLADFAAFHVFWGISRKNLNFVGPRPHEISEALLRMNGMYQRQSDHAHDPLSLVI